MAKSKKILSKRSTKKLIRTAELVVVLVAVCSQLKPEWLPASLRISGTTAILLIVFLGAATGAKPAQKLLKRTFLQSLTS